MKRKLKAEQDAGIAPGVVIALISIAMFVLFVLVVRIQHRNYVAEATNMVYEIKSETLKSNVQEIVLDIERFREWEKQRDFEMIRSFGTQMASDGGTILSMVSSSSGGAWLVNGLRFYIWDDSDNAVVFSSSNIEARTLQEMKIAVKDELAIFGTFQKGDETVICGINDALVDFRTKQFIYNKIHSLKFEDGSYIWVNEVINYEGGDNYAIRRIHPNLKDTEGMYLSTSMQDAVGNYPYLDELEGINAAGECYNTYYFKELNSDRISEKYTYAYLYRPYNWIICMGSYTSDIESYRHKLQQDSTWIMTVGIAAMAALLALLILSVTRLIRRMERLRFGKEREQLQKVATIDPLTGAVNRRGGMPRLSELLECCKTNGLNSCVVMIDIDNFKQMNDSYGHESGDKVLSAVADAIKRSFRAEDHLIRWGGDEFLLIVRGMGREGEELLRSKLYRAIGGVSVRAGNEDLTVQVSSGAAAFRAEDASPMDAVNRADSALYQAKRGGKGIMCTNW